MGHEQQAHFLQRLDRVARRDADFALSLYRDPELVAWVIYYANLGEPERVAIAIEHPERGPFLIVTRQGRFVTCLGEDMSPAPHPVVTRARFEALAKRVHEARARQALAQRVVPSGAEASHVIDLVVLRPDAISREELTAICGWQPVMMTSFYNSLVKDAAEVLKVRPRILRIGSAAPRSEPLLRWYWNALLTNGHRAILASLGHKEWLGDHVPKHRQHARATMSWPLARERVLSLSLRGAWLGARLGKAALADYRLEIAPEAWLDLKLIDAVMGLTAIGVRHANLASDARRASDRVVDGEPDEHPDWVSLRRGLADSAQLVFDAPDVAMAHTIALGRAEYVERARNAPEGSPYRVTDPAQVPEDWALLAVLDSDAAVENDTPDKKLLTALLAVAYAARARAEDFYMPDAMLRALRRPWRPARVLEVVERVRNDEGIATRRTGPKQGRNDRCACGSGKKFKKCCGG